MADTYAVAEAERVRLHAKRIVARVVTVNGVLVLQVKDSRITGERQASEQAGTWVTYADANTTQGVFT